MSDVTSFQYLSCFFRFLSHSPVCDFWVLSECVGFQLFSPSIYVWASQSDFMHIYLCVCIHILMFLPVLQNAPVAGRNRNPPLLSHRPSVSQLLLSFSAPSLQHDSGARCTTMDHSWPLYAACACGAHSVCTQINTINTLSDKQISGKSNFLPLQHLFGMERRGERQK